MRVVIPVFNGSLYHVFSSRLRLNHAFNSVRSQQQLVEGHASLKAGAIAGLTSFAAGQAEGIVLWDAELVPLFRSIALADFLVFFRFPDVLLLTIFANSTSEALGEDSQHRIGKAKRVAAHIEKPSDGFHGAVCVECAHDEVSGQRGFNADLSRFFISHFTDHDHVWVGPEERAHGSGKCEVDLRLNLNLPEPILGDFDGVFRRPDLNVWRINEAEDGVQGRGFS